MKLSQLKEHLTDLKKVNFKLPDGTIVPDHFHVTEIGQIDKKYIDCGGTIRNESVISFQLWHSVDYNHRLSAEKLLRIITLAERELKIEDHEIELEYQTDSITKFGISFDGELFHLERLHTTCLAQDKCNIPSETNIKHQQDQTSCTPGGGCC
ncbi:DUF6428 family protein [Cytophagaceae bacterium ABcell3]|nr:DUF6428 family protein [Cytophagaceae bacterium ABcell3]